MPFTLPPVKMGVPSTGEEQGFMVYPFGAASGSWTLVLAEMQGRAPSGGGMEGARQ